MRTRSAKYLIFQVTGWGLFIIVNLFFAYTFDQFNYIYLARLSIFVVLGVMFSHLMRFTIKRSKIFLKPLQHQVIGFIVITMVFALSIGLMETLLTRLFKIRSVREAELSETKLLLSAIFFSFVYLFMWNSIYFVVYYIDKSVTQQIDDLKSQQLIKELEKDKQLLVIDAVLKVQEEERSRFAKDLHDGLGGMLSGVKYFLANVKDNMVLTHENAAFFDRSLQMLDTSIIELRRVAHSMMPEALVKFGLDEALKDYINYINSSGTLHIIYQSFGMEARINNNKEIVIYRIIQELLTNILKHAKATEVLVQLIREGNTLSITVEDNGKGIDLNELSQIKGAGISNVNSRVDFLKGTIDFQSESGKGSSVNMEFNI